MTVMYTSKVEEGVWGSGACAQKLTCTCTSLVTAYLTQHSTDTHTNTIVVCITNQTIG